MSSGKKPFLSPFWFFVVLLAISCHSAEKPPEKDVVQDPAQLEERVSDHLGKLLNYSLENNGKINDSVTIRSVSLLQRIYKENNYETIWSREDSWLPIADSLFGFFYHIKEYGLFPSDYHVSSLNTIREQIDADSIARKDAALWTRADLLLTAAWLNIARDIRLGRLERDTVTLRNDSLLTDDYFVNHFNNAIKGQEVIQTFLDMEPQYAGYKNIREGLKQFLEADTSHSANSDSTLNLFKRIAITLDRYKLFSDTLPASYILVNIPSFSLYLYDADTIALQSKIIVGTPGTRTPVLNSAVTNFITYPQWTVPYSIIFKEMLPKIKKDVNYLTKQNLMVVDRNDSVVDPYKIDWTKMNKGHFPYLLRQRQGDDNSLGVMKFNFSNKFSVYLHDTNARWLFSKSNRALSHGCVRVEKWEQLSHFLVRNDTIKYPIDTLKAWITRQEKHVVSGFPRIPIYIRYFTVEGKNDGTLKFYNDIYKEDSILSVKYFAGKR